MTRIDVEVLRSSITGPVFGRDDEGYDDARSIWNGQIDHRPGVIARCRGSADVAQALRFARDNSLEVSVRGGGHSYRGASVCEDGLMIDLSALNSVNVDPNLRRARAGGGATMANLDSATQEHGLGVTGGVISDTGIGGLTLGGGMGWLTRSLGLSIDNLASAEVVLADGRVVRASEDDHPDLFWALRGGGGNFGVVTEFEYRLSEVGPEVHLGLFFWGMDDGPDALRLFREVVPALPGNAGALVAVSLSAPPAPFVPEQFHLRPGYALLVAGFGSATEHEKAIAPIRDGLEPLFEFVTPLPYVGLQSMLDESEPWGAYAYEKALDLEDFSDEVIDVLTEHAGKKLSPMSFMPIFPMQGAFTSVGEDETAFGGTRTPHYVCNMTATATDEGTLDLDREWVRDTWEALRPLSSNQGGYVNFMTDADEDRVRSSYGSGKYERLARIKAEYDPGNVFHLNANIKPAGAVRQ
ncbi:FAD-linked oxidoreductase [Rhodococcus sp. SRB_17]|uniref:FAD-binding oxidoreductase n=1 Tax=Rhodococcus sp. OK302 TaxID=1882769 RepID=UPI000B9F0998|nr:FAD-binding oxidoreductase [Rhodococcus sp. OK302]NMM91995.1 FAD-linked oxidoreductase [Rhodococcus sp. SRB_17]OYD69045.1 FAD/FMN-containing dehydrogenase [Rhodococcus sp. OK302]